jgi:hypothetical protein
MSKRVGVILYAIIVLTGILVMSFLTSKYVLPWLVGGYYRRFSGDRRMYFVTRVGAETYGISLVDSVDPWVEALEEGMDVVPGKVFRKGLR